MPNHDDILWFKTQFGAKIRKATPGSPFSLDMLTAIACQETGYIWSALRKQGLKPAEILRLCVGDTIDAKPGGKGRSAFPKTKAALVAHSDGPAMFAVARQALVDVAHYVAGYAASVANPDKFCHGYGIFQYDLQYFDKDKPYFLHGGYADFDKALAKCLSELKESVKIAHLEGKNPLTNAEMAAVAIAYNSGGYNASKGLKQGHFDGQLYYGEYIAMFIKAAQAVPDPPAPLAFKVHVDGTLRLRRTPAIATTNLIALMPNGQDVTALTGVAVGGFVEIETTLEGETLQGFAWRANLDPA